jgi:hypothetical protein
MSMYSRHAVEFLNGSRFRRNYMYFSKIDNIAKFFSTFAWIELYAMTCSCSLDILKIEKGCLYTEASQPRGRQLTPLFCFGSMQ